MARTFPIPGGEATFADDDELSVRQQRAIARATRRIRKDAIAATKLTVDGKEITEPDKPDLADLSKDLLGLPVDLTQDDVDAMWELGDVNINVRLTGWTLTLPDGTLRPIPADVDEIADLPGPLYAGLQEAVAEMMKDSKVDGFTVDAVEDPDSPTGA